MNKLLPSSIRPQASSTAPGRVMGHVLRAILVFPGKTRNLASGWSVNAGTGSRTAGAVRGSRDLVAAAWFGLVIGVAGIGRPDGCEARAWQDAAAGDSAVERWKAATAEIEAVVNKVKAATSANREAVLAEYREKLQEVNRVRREVEPQLLQVVQDATEIPAAVHDALLELGQIAVSEDSYLRAYQLLNPLVKAQSTEPVVYQYAALAAYGSDHFEAAQAIINKIKADGGELRIEFMRRVAPEMAERLRDWKAEETIRAQEAERDNLPRVKLETTAGDVMIELYEDQAPNTVANFISLVEKGYYDGLSFHRVLPQFMAQGGCPNGTGAGGPGYAIPCECGRADYRKHFSGTLSMAHAGKDTGGSQFFLTFLATPHLDGRHTAFGRVIEGLDVIADLEKVNPQSPDPSVKPSRIVKASVVRKRDHDYQVKTLPSRR